MRSFNDEDENTLRVLDVDTDWNQEEIRTLSSKWQASDATNIRPESAVHTVPPKSSLTVEVYATVTYPKTPEFDIGKVDSDWHSKGLLTRYGPVLFDFEFEEFNGGIAGVTVESVYEEKKNSFDDDYGWRFAFVDDVHTWWRIPLHFKRMENVERPSRTSFRVWGPYMSVSFNVEEFRRAVVKAIELGTTEINLISNDNGSCHVRETIDALVDVGRRSVYALRFDYVTTTSKIRAFVQIGPYGDAVGTDGNSAVGVAVTDAAGAIPLEDGYELRDERLVLQPTPVFEQRVDGLTKADLTEGVPISGSQHTNATGSSDLSSLIRSSVKEELVIMLRQIADTLEERQHTTKVRYSLQPARKLPF